MSLAVANFRKVGRVYGQFERHSLFEYPCNYLAPDADGSPHQCCHHSCRMDALRQAGFTAVAERLEGNAKAIDYRHNWGKLIYVDAKHGRDAKRRKAMAVAMRAMRDKHATNYADIIVAGCWQGALM